MNKIIALCFIILSNIVQIYSKPTKEQIRWLGLQFPVYPIAELGDTIIVNQGKYFQTYRISTFEGLNWTRLDNIKQYLATKFDYNQNKLYVIYLTTDYCLAINAYTIGLNLISSERLCFDKTNYPSSAKLVLSNDLLLFVTNNFNFYAMDYKNKDTLFDFSKAMPEAEDLVYSFIVTNDEQKAIIVGGKSLYFMDIPTFKITKTIVINSFPTHRFAISNDGRYLVRHFVDNFVDLIDLQTDSIRKNINTGKVRSVFFLDDNKSVLFDMGVGTNYIYSIEGMELVKYDSIFNLSLLYIRKNGKNKFYVNTSTKNYPILVEYDIYTKSVKKLVSLPMTAWFLPVGGKYLAFVRSTSLYSDTTLGIFDGESGRFIAFHTPDVKLYYFSYSNDSPHYYYLRNDTVLVRDIFSNEVVKMVELKEANPTSLQFSNKYKYLLYRSQSETDTCYKIINVENRAVAFEFKNNGTCIEPQFVPRGILNARAFGDFGKFSPDNKYYAFTYANPDDGTRVFSVVDLSKGEIIYNEICESPFQYEFGDTGSEEIFINNGSARVAKINLKTLQRYDFPEVSPYNSTGMILLNRANSPNLIQFFPGSTKSIVNIFNKVTGKLERTLIIDSVNSEIGSETISCYGAFFLEDYSILVPLLTNGVTLGLQDSLFLPSSVFEPTISNRHKFEIFPNPAKDELRIYFGNGEIPAKKVEIFDIFGNVCKTIVVDKGDKYLKLNVGDLPSGIYLVQIGNVNQKFIKIQ